MMNRPKKWRHPRLTGGQCPICEWWFDGYAVGAGDPTGNTAPFVEWALDARQTGRCVKHECFMANNMRRPILETPLPPALRRKAG